MKLTSIIEQKKTDIGRSIIKISGKGKIIVKITGEVNGLVEATPIAGEDLLVIESSAATGGYGPILYDIVLEVAGFAGKAVVSDRHMVSLSAYKVWQYYYFKRDDVEKIELPVGLWYGGPQAKPYIEKLTADKSTWPEKTEPIWSLWTAYRKNEPTVIQKLQNKIKMV